MTTPKKIAHILPWPNVGGTEIATLRVIRAVEGDEFENVAFHSAEAASVGELFADNGLETSEYEPVQLSYRNPQPFFRSAYRLAREFRERRIDLIHCSDVLGAYYAAWAGRLARIPVLCHVRNRFEALTRQERSFLFPVHHFAFVSENTWKHFDYDVRSDRGTVVYDGFQDRASTTPDDKSRLRREFGIPVGGKVVGMVARIAPQKDYPTLIKAAARVLAEDPNITFLIVGDHSGTDAHREHFAEVTRLIEAEGLTHNFVFTDFQPDVAKFIGLMDVFVLCTHSEGLPLVILEAMAQAKPVVATEVDGIPEIVLQNETGLLFPHKDDAELSEHILSLIRDEHMAVRLGNAGRRSVETTWTEHRFAEDMRTLYKKMLGAR